MVLSASIFQTPGNRTSVGRLLTDSVNTTTVIQPVYTKGTIRHKGCFLASEVVVMIEAKGRAGRFRQWGVVMAGGSVVRSRCGRRMWSSGLRWTAQIRASFPSSSPFVVFGRVGKCSPELRCLLLRILRDVPDRRTRLCRAVLIKYSDGRCPTRWPDDRDSRLRKGAASGLVTGPFRMARSRRMTLRHCIRLGSGSSLECG